MDRLFLQQQPSTIEALLTSDDKRAVLRHEHAFKLCHVLQGKMGRAVSPLEEAACTRGIPWGPRSRRATWQRNVPAGCNDD
jgi:hypothetical protein